MTQGSDKSSLIEERNNTVEMDKFPRILHYTKAGLLIFYKYLIFKMVYLNFF